MVLPVSPPSFDVSHGINIETINIHTLGDVSLPGYSSSSSIRVDCMFPSKAYPFNQPKTNLDPYSYIKRLEAWCDNHTILRFIISYTSINMEVIISDISYGEKDGSGDVYATINLREYKKLSAVQTSKTGNKSRSTEKEKTSVSSENYVIKKGDTLSAICRKYYGEASLYLKLAVYNNIKNPNIIFEGTKIKLPNKNQLSIKAKSQLPIIKPSQLPITKPSQLTIINPLQHQHEIM